IPLYYDAIFSLEAVLNQVIQENQSIWPDRIIHTHIDLPNSVRCDGKRLSQLFTNLLANALTHGNPGHPVIVTATTGGGYFHISVANRADPISPGTLQRLFQPFYRGDRGNRG